MVYLLQKNKNRLFFGTPVKSITLPAKEYGLSSPVMKRQARTCKVDRIKLRTLS